MAQYIDKDALVAEIEKELNTTKKYSTEYVNGKKYALKKILSFLDTLEVKEEILDKEGKTNLMQKCVREAYKRGYDMGVLQTTNKINHNMKEVDLEKEIDKIWNPRFNLGWDEKSLLSMNHKGFTTIAKHFFELGLKAQKVE